MANDYSEHQDRHKAVQQVCKAILVDRNNLIAGDFACIQAVPVSDLPCDQGKTGYLVQFAITHHALGKLPPLDDEMTKLLGYEPC